MKFGFIGVKKRKHIYLPWAYQWVRTSILLKDDTWFNESKKVRLNWEDTGDYGSYNWLEENKWQEKHPYTDSYDNTTVTATISVVEREWRPRWFKWTSIFSKVSKTIDVDFDKQVGKEKGSWKGGVLGCGYAMKPGETPLQCLRRMEKERKF